MSGWSGTKVERRKLRRRTSRVSLSSTLARPWRARASASDRLNPRPSAAMTTAAAPTLRDKQRSALESLLALNAASTGAQLPTWKVLVMDKVGQDVLATSLRVQDLRAAGVTLHVSVPLRTPRPLPAPIG